VRVWLRLHNANGCITVDTWLWSWFSHCKLWFSPIANCGLIGKLTPGESSTGVFFYNCAAIQKNVDVDETNISNPLNTNNAARHSSCATCCASLTTNAIFICRSENALQQISLTKPDESSRTVALLRSISKVRVRPSSSCKLHNYSALKHFFCNHDTPMIQPCILQIYG